MEGFSPSGPVRALGTMAVVVLGAACSSAARSPSACGWPATASPRGEEDFERVSLRAEGSHAPAPAAEPDETDFLDLDPYDDEDFEELVRDALDELPDLLRSSRTTTSRS